MLIVSNDFFILEHLFAFMKVMLIVLNHLFYLCSFFYVLHSNVPIFFNKLLYIYFLNKLD